MSNKEQIYYTDCPEVETYTNSNEWIMRPESTSHDIFYDNIETCEVFISSQFLVNFFLFSWDYDLLSFQKGSQSNVLFLSFALLLEITAAT